MSLCLISLCFCRNFLRCCDACCSCLLYIRKREHTHPGSTESTFEVALTLICDSLGLQKSLTPAAVPVGGGTVVTAVFKYMSYQNGQTVSVNIDTDDSVGPCPASIVKVSHSPV